MSSDILLIFSLFSLGFIGGFTHCTGMCGPFVISQVSSRLNKIDINKYSEFSRLTNLALLPYHLGRITTYSFLGLLSSFLTKNIQDLIGFRIFSIIFLFLALFIFINIFLYYLFKYNGFDIGKLGLFFKSKSINMILTFFKARISFLFKNPEGLKGFLLGVILGFIPCGLLYSALMVSANMNNIFYGMIGMAVFGFATFPSLFATAIGFDLFKNTNFFKFISIFFIIINIFTLSLLLFYEIIEIL